MPIWRNGVSIWKLPKKYAGKPILKDVYKRQALQGAEGIVSPKFDAGEEIYADLMARVDALLQTYLDGAQIDGEYDFIYGGDLGKWQDVYKRQGY